MCRVKRISDPNGIFHVMIRSINEINLFKNSNDKDKMLQIIKKYKEIFRFQLYGYCLMDTHAHFIINCNGSDLSKFMHSINLSYAMYYNKKYERHGHVFGDRFKSIPITDDLYLLASSAYVHNNPKDVKGYLNKVEEYKYSSFSIYLGQLYDKYKIINTQFILEKLHSDLEKARKKYYEFVKSRLNSNIDPNIELIDLKINSVLYENCNESVPLISNIAPNIVLDFVSSQLNKLSHNVNIKYNQSASNYRAICVLLMRSLCDYKYKDIGKILGNMSISALSKLCSKGYSLTQNNKDFQDILLNFLTTYSCSGKQTLAL